MPASVSSFSLVAYHFSTGLIVALARGFTHAVHRLPVLITRRSLVQIQLPQPISGLSFDSPFFMPRSPTNTTKRSASDPIWDLLTDLTVYSLAQNITPDLIVRQLKPDTVQVKPILRKVYPESCEA